MRVTSAKHGNSTSAHRSLSLSTYFAGGVLEPFAPCEIGGGCRSVRPVADVNALGDAGATSLSIRHPVMYANSAAGCTGSVAAVSATPAASHTAASHGYRVLGSTTPAGIPR